MHIEACLKFEVWCRTKVYNMFISFSILVTACGNRSLSSETMEILSQLCWQGTIVNKAAKNIFPRNASHNIALQNRPFP